MDTSSHHITAHHFVSSVPITVPARSHLLVRCRPLPTQFETSQLHDNPDTYICSQSFHLFRATSRRTSLQRFSIIVGAYQWRFYHIRSQNVANCVQPNRISFNYNHNIYVLIIVPRNKVTAFMCCWTW